MRYMKHSTQDLIHCISDWSCIALLTVGVNPLKIYCRQTKLRVLSAYSEPMSQFSNYFQGQIFGMCLVILLEKQIIVEILMD